MSKRMLRSVLAAAFSTVVAFGALSGFTGAKGDVQADSTWRTPATTVASDSTWSVTAAEEPADSTWAEKPTDSTWGKDDSTWAVES